MKPARFEYFDARSADAAFDQLAEHGDDARPLAGGQSLIPMLNFRLARPKLLVDISRAADLSGIRKRDGMLWIGATTSQATLERSLVARAGWPLIDEALQHLAHPPIRNIGTVGGSIAHADPAAELPAVLTALEATLHVRSRSGSRVIHTDDFFRSSFITALDPTELLVEIEVPPMPDGTGHGFVEVARRHGDFAVAGAAALITTDAAGACTKASVVLLAAGPRPLKARAAEQLLIGSDLDPDAIDAAAEAAVSAAEPTSDIHASADTRLQLIGAAVRRSIRQAAERAGTRIGR